MNMIQTILRETERGLLYRDGKLVEWLEPGRTVRRAWFAELRLETIDIELGYTASTQELRQIVPEGAAEDLIVKPGQLAVITVDGNPIDALSTGRYLLWQLRAEVRAWVFDIHETLAQVSEEFARVIPAEYLAQHTLQDNERGLLVLDGEARAWLQPGRHYVWQKNRSVQLRRFQLDQAWTAASPELKRLVPDEQRELLEVGANELAVVKADGRPLVCLHAGSYLLWQQRQTVTAERYSLRSLFTEIPEDCWDLIGYSYLRQAVVHPYERGLLYVDGDFQGLLEAGRYGIHAHKRQVEVFQVDMREQETQITGQEVMTADKVTIRINLIVKYRIVNALTSHEAQTDLDGSIYSEAQMAARRYVAGVKLDELLESRNEACQTMRASLEARAESWGVEILQIDLKDVILPGEMKALLNRVIEAEKQAAAQNIMRREETAATRSQANTAKMIENNPTLMRLKELEALREIAGEIEHITVVAGAEGLMKQLKLER